MKWCFWKKKQQQQPKTVLQISAGEGYIQTLYVETQGSDKALNLIKELKKLCEKERKE